MHIRAFKNTFFLIIILSLINLCSCKDIEPNLHIFSDIQECKKIENLKSKEAEVEIYDSPKEDKNLKKLEYQEFFGCEYKSDNFSFELFAYVFENDDIAMDYFENVTGKDINPNPTFSDTSGISQYRRIVISGNNGYVLTCKNTDREKVLEFINNCFSTKVQMGKTAGQSENRPLIDKNKSPEVNQGTVL